MQLAGLVLGGSGAGGHLLSATLGAGDRLATSIERIDELSLQHHDFGGAVNALLGGFIRKIDRLKAELIGAEEYAAWAWALGDEDPESDCAREREFAEIYRAHNAAISPAYPTRQPRHH